MYEAMRDHDPVHRFANDQGGEVWDLSRFENDFDAFVFAATQDYINLRRVVEEVRKVRDLEENIRDAFEQQTGCEGDVHYIGKTDGGNDAFVVADNDMPVATVSVPEGCEPSFSFLCEQDGNGGFIREWAR